MDVSQESVDSVEQLHELYKSLEKLNESLEKRTIEPMEVPQHLMNAIESISNVNPESHMTQYQKTQLMTIASRLGTMMKTSLQRNFGILKTKNANEERALCAVGTAGTQVSVSSGKDVFEEFLCPPRAQGFVSLCGMEDMLKNIAAMFILPLYQPQLFQHQSAYRSLLLHGPPGCGKTQLVHALSNELHAKLYCLTPGNVMSKFVGATEKVIQKVFERLRTSTNPTILFVDEVDAFCRSRSEQDMDHSRRLKIEFLHQLDATTAASQSKLIVVAATNVPWEIDTAVMRRFQQQLHLGLPHKEQRSALLQFYLGETASKTPFVTTTTTERWEQLLDLTDGYSNSDLKEVVRCGLQQPIIELLDVKTWTSNDGMFSPSAVFAQENANISCTIYDLPSGTVKSRAIEISDLIFALRSVPRTVPDTEIAKFQQFLNRNLNSLNLI